MKKSLKGKHSKTKVGSSQLVTTMKGVKVSGSSANKATGVVGPGPVTMGVGRGTGKRKMKAY